MSWQCRLIEFQRDTTSKTLKIGDMFYGPTHDEVKVDDVLWRDRQVGLWWPYAYCKDYKLSEYYRQHNSHRRPLLMWMPGGLLFCLDSLTVNHGTYGVSGWEVTGEAPLITVSPSINLEGIYHGFLKEGILSPDCEGRKYNEEGKLKK